MEYFDTITPDNITQTLTLYKNGGKVSSFNADTDVMEAPEHDPPQSVSILTGGNWYLQNPDRNLGEIKIDSDRYGKEIKVVVGTIANIDKIDASDDFDQFIKAKNIAFSAVDTVNNEINKPENESFIKSIIDKSNATIGKKAVRERQKKEEFADDTTINEMDKVQPYWEVFQRLNPDISIEELKAYVWYKNEIGQRLSDDWYIMAQFDKDDRSYSEMIMDWVKTGILCYYAGSLLPQPIYLSGNMYEKINRIIKSGDNSGQDIEYIVSVYGSEALVQQIELINKKYNEVYSKRLILTGNADENSLIIKPISKLAKTFKVSHLQDFEKFKWWMLRDEPNWEREEGSDYQKQEFAELSLTDAFIFWLLNMSRKIDILGNITYRDIIYFYIQGRTKQTPPHFTLEQEEQFKADLQRTKSKAMSEGNRLFLVFLDEQLELNDRIRLETTWNSQYNNYLAPDYNRIPVAFNVAKEFGGEVPFVVKPEKREGVAALFNEGSGCVAYDVGVGKTMTAIMAVEQFLVAGYCKRPFIVVPNQTYKQWISEIKGILPHRRINGLFNLGVDYIEEVLDEYQNPAMVPEGSITIMTYEGFRQIGFNEFTQSEIMSELYTILNQGGVEENMSAKKKAGFFEKLEMLVGRGLKGTAINIEALGLDYVTFDEAHALKKIFTSVKGGVNEETGKKDTKNPYTITSGLPSDTALKGFMISQYILRKNNYRNVVLLTATPFTNSPLEVYSMLSMVAYHHLKHLGINNLKEFFDTYIDAEQDLVINHKLQPEYKQVIKGFNNLPALQRIILRFFNYKDGDDVGVVRPSKIVVPYLKKVVNNVVTDLPENERVNCYITLNDIQKQYMAEIVAYAEGGPDLESRFDFDFGDDESDDTVKDSAAAVVEEAYLSDKEKSGVRALKAMNHSRNLALSPYLYRFNRLGKPTYKQYIESSPKLQYVIECIRSVKQYHENNNEPVSGQVIYMDRGIEYFPLIKEYLVKVVGFQDHEVGMIFSKGMSVDKKRAVQDAFLGRKYNDKTQEYEDISDSQRMKVLLGSSSIKEGMNLQRKSTVLYNCFLDWNPTDMLQLQGRIWRQQNEFLYVRIVNPLMIDSIDIFMFQKLEEKTSRINTIWSNDGRSVLKIEEVNPAEIKYALIKDPKVIAKIEIDDKKVRIEDDIKASGKIIDRLEAYKSAVEYINVYKDNIDKLLEKFAPEKTKLDLDSKLKAVITFINAKEQRDLNGLYMAGWYERTNDRFATVEKYGPLSPFDREHRPYWLDSFIIKNRLIQKENKDLLKPRNVHKEGIDDYIDYLRRQSEELKEQVKHFESAEYIDSRVAEIVEYREKNKIEEKSVSELVKEFSRLNNLLSEKRIKKAPAAVPVEFNRLNPDGTVKTDEISLQLLEQQVLRLPQTKTLHVDENGEYTAARNTLHEEIIHEIKKGVTCVTQTQPIAILTGGSPASGKSSFLREYAPYLLSEEIFHIDADEIRAMLPEYEGWNAASTHLETKDIVNRLLTDREIGVPCNFDLIYDGTMNNTKNYLPLIGLLKSLGYKVFIVYMDNVPYAEVKERMISRYRKTGRFVPMEVINDFFGKGKDALYELKNKVDGYMIVDASSKDYKIIESGGMKLPTDRSYSKMQKIDDYVPVANKEKEVIDGITLTRFIQENGKTNIRMEKDGNIFGVVYPSIIYPNPVSNKEAIAEYKKHYRAESDPTVDDIKATIEGLKVLLKISPKNEKSDIKATIEGLEVLLLYSEEPAA